MARLALLLLPALLTVCQGVTLYEYYAPGGVVSSGLTAEGPTFQLNGKDIKILSGSFHYFRVHPDYWRDTLKKYRAAGLNAIQMYVPWNLHEPRQGVFDFGDLGEDKSMFLDVRSFIQMAQEEDLFVLFRPGPYICGEWEFGGFPSWLLRDHTMHVRSYYENYRLAAEAYFNQLLPMLSDLQFTSGGPIIAVQIENEFGSFAYSDEPRDLLYLDFVRDTLVTNGFGDSLLYTSDTTATYYDWGSLPGVFMMANFKSGAQDNFDALDVFQPGRPKMVAEFWTGWFDHWLADIHQSGSVEDFADMLEYILSHDSSVNMYMFIGGTNFGFMAGANTIDVWPHYAPIVTSYDYGAPLSEAGDYTEKYDRAVEIISRYNPLQGIVDNPAAPAQRTKSAYGDFAILESLAFSDIVNQVEESYVTSTGPINMEALPINDGNGQSYGYILYSAIVDMPAVDTNLTIRGYVRDMAQVMLDGQLITTPYAHLTDISTFGYWNGRGQSLTLPGTGSTATLDILVENLGRVNFGKPNVYVQKKGLWERAVLLGSTQLDDWTMTPLELKTPFINGLTGYSSYAGATGVPSMYRTSVSIAAPAQDTYLDMRAWGKGVVFLNGFNLGRYWSVGPTKTLYIPAPLFVEGANEVVVFEQYDPADVITFIDYPILS